MSSHSALVTRQVRDERGIQKEACGLQTPHTLLLHILRCLVCQQRLEFGRRAGRRTWGGGGCWEPEEMAILESSAGSTLGSLLEALTYICLRRTGCFLNKLSPAVFCPHQAGLGVTGEFSELLLQRPLLTGAGMPAWLRVWGLTVGCAAESLHQVCLFWARYCIHRSEPQYPRL